MPAMRPRLSGTPRLRAIATLALPGAATLAIPGVATLALSGLAVATLALPGLAVAQPPAPPNPGSACFDVVLRSDAAVEFRGGIEFIFAPSISSGEDDQPWPLRGPIRSDQAALWWPLGGDSIAAVWVRDDGALWGLRLDAAPEVMQGSAVQVIPEPEPPVTLRVEAAQVTCPRDGG